MRWKNGNGQYNTISNLSGHTLCSTKTINPAQSNDAENVSALRIGLTAQAQRPPPETPGRLQQSLPTYLNRPTAQRGGGSLQRSG